MSLKGNHLRIGAVFLLTLAGASIQPLKLKAADGATYVVDSQEDSPEQDTSVVGQCLAENSQCTLRAALTASENTPDVTENIYFHESLDGVAIQIVGQDPFKISSSVNIVGRGTDKTILVRNTDEASAFFKINLANSDASVTVSNLTLRSNHPETSSDIANFVGDSSQGYVKFDQVAVIHSENAESGSIVLNGSVPSTIPQSISNPLDEMLSASKQPIMTTEPVLLIPYIEKSQIPPTSPSKGQTGTDEEELNRIKGQLGTLDVVVKKVMVEIAGQRDRENEEQRRAKEMEEENAKASQKSLPYQNIIEQQDGINTTPKLGAGSPIPGMGNNLEKAGQIPNAGDLVGKSGFDPAGAGLGTGPSGGMGNVGGFDPAGTGLEGSHKGGMGNVGGLDPAGVGLESKKTSAFGPDGVGLQSAKPGTQSGGGNSDYNGGSGANGLNQGAASGSSGTKVGGGNSDYNGSSSPTVLNKEAASGSSGSKVGGGNSEFNSSGIGELNHNVVNTAKGGNVYDGNNDNNGGSGGVTGGISGGGVQPGHQSTGDEDRNIGKTVIGSALGSLGPTLPPASGGGAEIDFMTNQARSQKDLQDLMNSFTSNFGTPGYGTPGGGGGDGRRSNVDGDNTDDGKTIVTPAPVLSEPILPPNINTPPGPMPGVGPGWQKEGTVGSQGMGISVDNKGNPLGNIGETQGSTTKKKKD